MTRCLCKCRAIAAVAVPVFYKSAELEVRVCAVACPHVLAHCSSFHRSSFAWSTKTQLTAFHLWSCATAEAACRTRASYPVTEVSCVINTQPCCIMLIAEA